ncbi:hypothetical protein JTB14_019573 [Gonioctena quinquepunctata]|nr:hypothetical protein JTB14_019573 [Gonioctena quinquepunctata]
MSQEKVSHILFLQRRRSHCLKRNQQKSAEVLYVEEILSVDAEHKEFHEKCFITLNVHHVPIQFEVDSGAARNSNIIKRVPKATEISAAPSLSNVIDECVETNTTAAWVNLFMFAYRTFIIPHSIHEHNQSLASLIKKNILNPSNLITSDAPLKENFTNIPNLTKRVVSKISAGDISSAIRIMSSSDTVANFDSSALYGGVVKIIRSTIRSSSSLS